MDYKFETSLGYTERFYLTKKNLGIWSTWELGQYVERKQMWVASHPCPTGRKELDLQLSC